MFTLFLLAAYVARTHAIYYMDDRNSSILYNLSSIENCWNLDLDEGAVNRTLTYSQTATCLMVIPFIGSGITLYAAHDGNPLSVNVTLDGNQNSTFTKTVDPDPTKTESHNVSIYDVQSLPFDNHKVTVQVLPWPTNGTSQLWFDYAAINDTYTTSSSSASGSRHLLKNLGAIIGGAVGGLIVLAAVVTMHLHYRRSQREREVDDPVPEPQHDSTRMDVILSPKVYKNTMQFLNKMASASSGPPDANLIHLSNLQTEMATSNTLFNLVHSHRFHAQLTAMALALACQDDPGFRKALDDDDRALNQLLRNTLNSDTDREAVSQLKGEDAEHFLTLIYSVLDKQASLFDCDEEASKSKAHRLVVKLAESCGFLPDSINIIGVTDCGKVPISGGGFADVFRATYQGMPVALKCLRDFQMNQQRQKNYRKFCREALLWRSLDHPNVLPFYGVDFETFLPRACMVSPWMSNGTLMKHIENHGGPLSIDVWKNLLEIAEGLVYLHSENIIHGDLKGNNVFIDEHWHARLADFGLAGWADATMATSTSNHAGSVRWMAPELHAVEPSPFCRTKRSDVFAFACVSVEVYTGKCPFYDINRDITVSLKVKQGERPKRPTAHMEKTMSDELWGLVEMCWKQDPSERPQMEDVVKKMVLMST